MGHLILLKRLEFSFGINEKAFTWVTLYLTDITQCYHCYADDTQLYMTLKPSDKWDAISASIEPCIGEIMLKVNKDKTEFIVLPSNLHVKIAESLCFKIGFSYVNYYACKPI